MSAEEQDAVVLAIFAFFETATLDKLQRFADHYKRNAAIPGLLRVMQNTPLGKIRSGGIDYENTGMQPGSDKFIASVDSLILHTISNRGTFKNNEKKLKDMRHIRKSVIEYYSISRRNPRITAYWEYILQIRAAAALLPRPPSPLSLSGTTGKEVEENDATPVINPRWAAIKSPTLIKGVMHGGGGGTKKASKKIVQINGGHKFRIEDPSKNWTLTNRYKKWVGKLTRKTTGRRHTKAEDLCVGKDNICEGDLGIPRKYMPQFIGKDDVKKFRNFIKRVYGIKSRTTRRKAKELKPTQKEISRERIEDLIENEKILTKVLVPLVISNDNYVVDGHHRWAAYRVKKPNKSLPVVEIDVPIKDVLGISIAWGAKHQDF